jgi:hypothetical protein
MLQYLATVEARQMSLVECLNFLFQLSFATLGKVNIKFLMVSSNLFPEDLFKKGLHIG